MRRASLVLFLLPLSTGAHAHAGHAHEASIGWTLDPSVTAPLGLALALYVAGFVRLWRRSQRGQARLRREAITFGLGWFVLSAALVSPLHEAGERSFAAHMVEHELIMLVATLLLALSGAGATLLWGLPAPARLGVGRFSRTAAVERLWTALASPWNATLLQAVALWLWHAPAMFNRALTSEGWHIFQHASFFLTSLIFWWAMMRAEARGRGGVAATCLLVTAIAGAGLGALMALSASPWYAAYAAMGMTPFGLSPEQDQQLAGLIMWIPGGVVHMAAALLILHRWLLRAGGSDAVPAR